MIWTDRIRQVKILLVVAAVLIAVASLVVSHFLVRDLAQEERSRMEVWAEAMRSLNMADENTDLQLVLKVINENNTIPVIVLDPKGNAQLFRNIKVDAYGNHYRSGLDVTNPEAIKYIYSLYDEYMEAEGDDEKDKFQSLMEDVVERSCLALMVIVDKADLVTLPDGTYDLKKEGSMIIPSLSAEDDDGNELSYLPLFTSNEQIDKWGIKDNVELKEGQVLVSQCRPFDQHIATFLGAGEYDALLINPFDQAFIINKKFIEAISGNLEEE